MRDQLLRTYEELKAYVGRLHPAASSTERELGFADADRSIAVSRNQNGHVEVFLVGERLRAARDRVEQAMEYRDTWQSANEGSLRANQLTLPGDVHSDSAAALICIELLDAGYRSDPRGAFAQVEALIEKFIIGSDQIGPQALVGLWGELILLDALTAAVEPGTTHQVIRSWFGWRPSSRDFQLGAIGVEVKTTSASTSTHHIQGFHQVEIGHPVTDVAETSLYLLSLGVLAIPNDQHLGESVPVLVDRILQRIGTHSVRGDFLDQLQQYGGDARLGYKHSRDRDRSQFQQRFSLTFERLYDLADDHLKILKRPNVAEFSHIDADSIEFRVDLPYPFRGLVNPVTGLDSIIGSLREIARDQ